jgi:hypothetical protein
MRRLLAPHTIPASVAAVRMRTSIASPVESIKVTPDKSMVNRASGHSAIIAWARTRNSSAFARSISPVRMTRQRSVRVVGSMAVTGAS